MTTIKQQIELEDKIILGLKKTYEKLLEYKRQKKSVLVILKDNKISRIKP